MKYLPFLILAVIAAGCKQKSLYKMEFARQIEVKVAGEDVKIPSDVWNLIEDKGIKESQKIIKAELAQKKSEEPPSEHGQKTSATHGEPVENQGEGTSSTSSLTQAGANFNFVPVKVFLTEKNKGVLRESAFEISLPRGGGKVDLSEFTTGITGTFYVAIEMELPEGITSPSTVHFVSNSRQRKVDGKIIGSGCDVFMDIKDFLLKAQESTGVVVNTNRNRHLSVLGGTFVMSAKGERETSITQVTFVDSKKPEYFCEYLENQKAVIHGNENEHEDELELPQ